MGMNFWFSLTLCLVLALLSLVLSLGFGSVAIEPHIICNILWQKIANSALGDWGPAKEIILWQVRAPRAILALLVGGGLAVVGAVMQATVRNSLADPYLLGLSSGASTGAAFAIYTGALSSFSGVAVPAMAFAGSLTAFFLVYFIAKDANQLLPNRLILSGLSVTYFFSALTSLLSFLAPEHSLREITYWLLGSVAAAKWASLPLPAFIVCCGSIFLYLRTRELDVLVLGDETAVSLGVDPQRFRVTVFITISLMTGVIVAETGAIGFVGLMIPHFIRLFGVNSYAKILPMSFLVGGIFLIWADVIARTAASPEELPIGIITSLCGAPCFIWILKTSRGARP